jgi:hypothetical protein
VVLDLLSWSRSTVTMFALNELVNGGQLAPNVEGSPPARIVPPATDREPNPSYGYVVSFVWHHERSFAAPASRFMRGLCYHYRVHNFAPNAISQAATFVGVREGFLGIPVNWDLWVHLFRAELHTVATPEARVRRVVRAVGLSISLQDSHKEFYIPCTMTSNNAEWERGWFYLRNDGADHPPYTGKVLKEKADSWHHGLSPSSCKDRLESLLIALKSLADARLGAASVLANLHHRPIIPLMERELIIYEMSEAANPTSLARSRLLYDRFPPQYAAMRARHAISLKAGWRSNGDLWSFVMLPDTPAVSRPSSLSRSLATYRCVLDSRFLAESDRGCLAVQPAHAPSPSGHPHRAVARAGAGRVQEGEEDPAAGAPGAIERGVSAVRAAGALSPDDPGEFVVVVVVGGGERQGAPPERWNPPPPSPRTAEAAEEQAPVAGAKAPVTRRSVEEVARVAKASASTAGASGSAATVMTGSTAAPAEPSRKRKRGFSTLR